MLLTAEVLAEIAGTPISDNIKSVVLALNRFGLDAGLHLRHRLAHFIAQVAHESGAFRHDREIWGPTAAQKRYDTRTDLGNTPQIDGDGKKFAGHGPLQVTGKANHREFRDWCRAQGYNPPDFVEHPELINTDPWEGLSAIWYWKTRKLNEYADRNGLREITKIINGGYNGLDDRINWYVRAALVLIGFRRTDLARFQKAHGLTPDGKAGPVTLAKLHEVLSR